MSGRLTVTECTEQQTPCIVDVRSSDEYLSEHIPGSSNIPLDRLSQQANLLRHLPQVILSCQSGKRAQMAKEQLDALGLTNTFVLEGSLNAWKQAGRPITSQKASISIMRQVQMIVGVMVLSGLLVPTLRPFTWLAGAGMLFAGLSNTCMMAALLANMPWNKPKSNASSGNTCYPSS